MTTIIADQNIISPLSGKTVRLEDVQDAVFAEKMMGDGLAILPVEGKVVAPFDGVVEVAFETKHAIGLKSYDGCELLIHVGLDTVELNGKGFTSHVKKGDSVSAGDLLLEFDLESIQKAGYDTTTPIVVTNSALYESILQTEGKKVRVGDPILALKA